MVNECRLCAKKLSYDREGNIKNEIATMAKDWWRVPRWTWGAG